MDRLSKIRKCNSRIFYGKKADHWIVEKRVLHLEKLFHDTFVEEQDKVWTARHINGVQIFVMILTPIWQSLLGKSSRSYCC